MREIKFRAWDSIEKEMITRTDILHNCTFNESDNGFHMGRTGKNGDWSSFEIMQFTGLKDKNGKEIYEGDIVKGKCYGHEYTVEVKYFGGGFAPFAEHDEKVCITFDSVKGTEVIGNIYEHPELLKP